VNLGDQVPDFELPDETGTPRRLGALLDNGPVVLFFYPVASSGGCTQEVCHVRDLAAAGRDGGRRCRARSATAARAVTRAAALCPAR
jgi:peroxiredoxin Q/BCP